MALLSSAPRRGSISPCLNDTSGNKGISECRSSLAGIVFPIIVALETHNITDTSNSHHRILLMNLLCGLIDTRNLHFHCSDTTSTLQPVCQNGVTAHQGIA